MISWRRARWCMLLLVGLLLVVAIKERYDPYLVLFLDDLVQPKPAPVTVSLNEDLALRLYSDTRPHIGKVASLQKGLVLVYRGKELIEEGFGFGMPIVQVGEVAYLSRHAASAVAQDADGITLAKTFSIDVADRPTRFLQVKYEDVEPLGTVVISYTLRGPATIAVEVDFTGQRVGWDRAYLMNEQGAISFPVCQDSQGALCDQVGRWEPVTDPVRCWGHKDGALRFCVETEAGRHKFVGRERYNQYRWTGIFYLSWSGVDIEIDPPLSDYAYTVRAEPMP